MDGVFAWVHTHPRLVTALAVLSALTFVGSLVLVPVLLARMPADYFVVERTRWARSHPVVRWTVLLVKNAVGGLLLLAGLAMLVLPGQGLLTLLAAVALLNFPGKRRLELWIATRRPVRRGTTWLREHAGRPPLLYPGEAPPPPAEAAPDADAP